MDMLIKLYALPALDAGSSSPQCVIRKPLGPERDLVTEWIAREFSAGWASEARVALGNRPVSLFIALNQGALAGFCCYDATARGLVGPVGVAEAVRGGGIGAALLRACLGDMHAVGYVYAIAGAVGAPGFFRRVAGAVEIDGSTPGLYRDLVRR